MITKTDREFDLIFRAHDARCLQTSVSLLLTLVILVFLLPLHSITVSELTNSDDYLYGRGKARNYEKATDLALKNLISKISVKVEASFERNDQEDETGYHKRVESNISTYSSTTLYNVPDIMEQNQDSVIVYRYIKKKDLDQIFADRHIKIMDYYGYGRIAEQHNQIGDALRNYYWALELLSTHPDGHKLKTEDDASILKTLLFNKINELLDGTKFDLKEVMLDEKNNRRILKFNVTYKGRTAVNLNYRYYTTESGWSRYNAVNDGLTYIDLPLDYDENKLSIQLQYRYEQKANVDKEIQKVLSGIEADYFNNSQKELLLLLSDEPEPVTKVNLDVYDLKTNEKLSELSEKDRVEKLLNSIRTGKTSDIRQLFSDQGYKDYENILSYGKAEVLENDFTLIMETCFDEKQLRGVPMRFSFPNNGVEFIEKVNFLFNEQGLINGITFSLGDRAIRDIMAKDETMWKPQEKYHLISFMEYYKTAYCLEDIDFIDHIFAENALIITGRVVEDSDYDIENITNTINPQKIEYIRYEKDEYIEHLRQVFNGNEYVNLQFEDNEIKHYSNDADSALYAIQIKQNYYSQNYGDKGYLFLMMDLQDLKKPQIYIRTWQPEKFGDGSIFGVDDFRMN